ncbi:hypothetical protein AXX17_AT4G06830 [Arabidopsis thaliana]|uniref:Uncharacterized protein n=1 Tax=Arabidopsis thaliana TaxID=3702 RepID=A0A178UWG7_ARATH|nr:hypothetical protein AXX17_AT4G06830 [Arabidopsis thaliana]
MARRRRIVSFLCCLVPLSVNQNWFRLKLFAHLLSFFPSFISLLRRVVLRFGGFSSLKISGSPVRCALPPTGRTSSYFAAGLFPLFFPCRLNRHYQMIPLDVVSSTSLHGELCLLLFSVFDVPFAVVNRHRHISSASLELVYIIPSANRSPLCQSFASSRFITHRFTGNFSGFSLPMSDISSVGSVCYWFSTTFAGSISA